MSTAPATLGQAPFAALPVRTENATMAIVGIAHGTSHFFHLTLAPLLLGMIGGVLTMLLGVGGGFIMVPAMLYLLGMGTQVVVGTSLFQILFVTIATTMVHALTTGAVDIVLAALLLLGSVVGAQFGARFAQKARPEYLRLALAVIVLLVALQMAVGLFIRPDEIYSVQ